MGGVLGQHCWVLFGTEGSEEAGLACTPSLVQGTLLNLDQKQVTWVRSRAAAALSRKLVIPCLSWQPHPPGSGQGIAGLHELHELGEALWRGGCPDLVQALQQVTTVLETGPA